MNINNLVSIIIPCYNQAEYLEESIQSALNQTYSNIEIIIVNDGSTDNTLEIAQKIYKQYPAIIRVVDQENKGLSEARNSGIRNANGTCILPLDADDLIDVNMIEICVKALIAHNVDIIYTDYRRFGADDSVIITHPSVELYNLQFSNIFGATALYKRNVWEQAGGYKVNMKGGYEDWEFWINAAKSGFSFFHVDKPLFSYRVKEISMYTEALERHRYLHSKIMLNHPELFTLRQLDIAISSIHNEDGDALNFFFPLILKRERSDLTLEVKALERTERFMAEKLDWLENDYKLKENHIKNIEAIRDHLQKELNMKEVHINNLKALLKIEKEVTIMEKIKRILRLNQ